MDCCCSVTQSCLFMISWTAACQASLSFTIPQSLLKLTFTELVKPFNHLTLFRPVLLPPSIFPSIRVFSNAWGLPYIKCSIMLFEWTKEWTSFTHWPNTPHPAQSSWRPIFADDRLAVSGGVLDCEGGPVLNSLHLCLRRERGQVWWLSDPVTQIWESAEVHSGEGGEGATLLPWTWRGEGSSDSTASPSASCPLLPICCFSTCLPTSPGAPEDQQQVSVFPHLLLLIDPESVRLITFSGHIWLCWMHKTLPLSS